MHASKWQRVFLLIFIVTSTYSCASATVSPVNIDRSLINSLLKNDLVTARELLEQGANPEVILGKRLKDNAVCTAIDGYSSEPLELLVEFGASPNAFWAEDAHVTQRTPLVCAIQLSNSEAFFYLLDNGADPAVDLYPEAREKFRNGNTSFTNAIGLSEFPMAIELIRRYELRPLEISYAVSTLEVGGYDRSHPWNSARNEVIEWISERVPDFKPVLSRGEMYREKNECIFSSRDRAHRLKKGTICPPYEE